MYLCHGFNHDFKVSKFFRAHIIEFKIFPGIEKTILIKGHKSDILKVVEDLKKTGHYDDLVVRFPNSSKRHKKYQFLFPLNFIIDDNKKYYNIEKRYYGGKKK